MNEKHISSRFDADLRDVSNRVLEMGGLAESQVVLAMHALAQMDGDAAAKVLQQEERVNQMEVEIDATMHLI